MLLHSPSSAEICSKLLMLSAGREVMFSSSLMNWAVVCEGRDMAIAARAKSLDMWLRREALWDVLLLITASCVCVCCRRQR